MIEIKSSESTLGFPVPYFFDRTERYVERLVDCTREELIDLNFFYLDLLEKTQGMTEKLNQVLEESIGYNEPLFTIKSNEQ